MFMCEYSVGANWAHCVFPCVSYFECHWQGGVFCVCGQSGSGMFRRFSWPGHAWLDTDRDSRQNKNSAGLLCFSRTVECWQAGFRCPLERRLRCWLPYIFARYPTRDGAPGCMELSADPNCWAIWASWKCMDLDVPSLFQNRRVKIPGLESLRWHAQWSSGHHTSGRHKKCDFYYINIINTGCLLQRKPKSQEHLKMKSASEILAFFETDSQPWCLCHRHQRYLAVCFYSHIPLELNTIPSRNLSGWCQAERHRTLYVPLCPDTFRYYMQEMRFSRKAGYFRNCCNAIEWRMLILSLGPTWLQPIMSGKRIPCWAMFGSLLWNWKHCLQVYCVTSF